MKQIWIATLGLALLTTPDEAPAAPTQAFEFAQGPSDVAYQTVVRRLKVGQNVRVTTDTARFPLRWAGASLDGISGALPEMGLGDPQAAVLPDTASIQWSEIRRIDVRGRATGTGWPIGLVVGAIGGIAAGVALSQITLLGGHEPSREEVTRAALYSGVAGAIGGALAGAIIGTAFPKWHAIYKQKSKQAKQ